GKTSNPGDGAGELVGHLPCGVEGSDTAGGKSGDGAAVAVFSEIIFCRDVGEDFVAKETWVAIADGVVQRAAHGIFQRAVPFCAVYGVIERVELAQLIDGRGGIPEIGVRQLNHWRARQVVDHEERKGRRAGREEKIGAATGPCCSLLQVFGVEGGSGGVAEGWAGRFGEFDELRRGEFLRGGWKRRGNQENRETERD